MTTPVMIERYRITAMPYMSATVLISFQLLILEPQIDETLNVQTV